MNRPVLRRSPSDSPCRYLWLLTVYIVFHGASVLAASDVILTLADLESTMLPHGSIVSKHTVSLTDNMREWMMRQYKFTPPENTVDVYLAREPQNGRLVGGMILGSFEYNMGQVQVAIGLSEELRVSRAAIVAVPDQQRQDFESSIGVGYLKRYTMLSARQLRYIANVLNKEGKPTSLVADRLFQLGAILATAIHFDGDR